MLSEGLRRPREGSVDHFHRILQSVNRRKRAEARAFLLPQQNLIEHIEPFQRHAGLAVLGLALAAPVEERLAPADLVDYVLDLLGAGVSWKLRKRITQISERSTLDLGRLAELLRRQHEVAIVVNCI